MVRRADIGPEVDDKFACELYNNDCLKCKYRESCDFDWIYKLFSKNSDLLGPPIVASLKKSLRSKEILVFENLGFCEFHPSYRTGHVTIYHICVAPEARGKGVAKQFIKYLCDTYQLPVQAICIKDSSSEAFWSRVAEKVGEKKSRKGTDLCIYIKQVDSPLCVKENLFS